MAQVFTGFMSGGLSMWLLYAALLHHRSSMTTGEALMIWLFSSWLLFVVVWLSITSKTVK